MMRRGWLNKFVRVGAVKGVPISVHWTVPAICIFILGVQIEHVLTSAAGLLAYLCMLAVHELGHQLVGQSRGYQVIRIEIYPLHGLCILDRPEAGIDAALVAVGGATAQFIVAVPFILYRMLFGYTGLEPANAFIAILGFFSPAIALFNLLPIPPLDGAKFWPVVPLLFRGRWRRGGRSDRADLLKEFEEIARKVNRSR